MYKKDSDYALNKHSPNIAYRSVDGSLLEVGPEDCPDFERWKALSDESYHAEELHGLRTTRRNISMYDLPDRDSAVEEVLASKEPPSGSRTIENAMRALASLTETQRRRYLLHVRDGISIRKIASQEQVDPMAIQHSIAAAKKKIKKFRENRKNGSTGGQKNDA